MTNHSDGQTRNLLARILDTTDLARAVPQLAPDTLHQIIRHVGLEDCGSLVAMATPEQLSAVLDLDLWRSDRPAGDERFDPDRFGTWLETLNDTGPETAARILSSLDPDLVVAGFAQYIRVFDPGASVAWVDGEQVFSDEPLEEMVSELGGFQLLPRRTDNWDAIFDSLAALDAHAPDAFVRIMHGCRRLSNDGFERDELRDLLDAGEQALFDLAAEREVRREQQGYITPARAAAFLRMSRTVSPSRTYVEAGPRGTYVEAGLQAVRIGRSKDRPLRTEALLTSGGDAPPPFALVHRCLDFLLRHDPETFAARNTDLAFLANVLAAGCSLQERAFTPKEAGDAALAICNLGLDAWPGDTRAGDDFLQHHDLIVVFQAGWQVLYTDVVQFTAKQLLDLLSGTVHGDSETRRGLDALCAALRTHLRGGEPWRARPDMDVLAILDTPAWAALLGLIDECPTLHEALGSGARVLSVSNTRVEFISEMRHVARAREFVSTLASRLMT